MSVEYVEEGHIFHLNKLFVGIQRDRVGRAEHEGDLMCVVHRGSLLCESDMRECETERQQQRLRDMRECKTAT